MAQQHLSPEEPQAGATQAAPLSASAVPPSPTKSLWRKILSRGVSNGAEVPGKDNAAEPPPVAPPVALSPAPASVPAVATPQPATAAAPPAAPAPALDASDAARPPAAGANGINTAGSDGAAPKPAGNSRRTHREVVPGLPRAQTFARQQSELRENLLPVKPTPAERRAVSVGRRQLQSIASPTSSQILSNPRSSAPDFTRNPRSSVPDLGTTDLGIAFEIAPPVPSAPSSTKAPSVSELSADELGLDRVATATRHPDGNSGKDEGVASAAALSAVKGDGAQHSALETHSHPGEATTTSSVGETHLIDTASLTSSQYEHRIRYELEHIWILNLSMHFRDKSRREKFFVTYRQRPDLARRVTVSLDYRDCPENSLEADLMRTKLQRDKNEMIYEAIRESLVDIQFYHTVTNLKLQTTNGRLHVHVVEDVSEVIDYPPSRFVQHLHCRKVRERDLEFDSHMSGFVYKVRVDGRVLIKKEIPGPDSVDEFLYEVNALNFLRDSPNVIELYGVIISDDDRVKGLLISYAEQGALIDIVYENDHKIPWFTRVRWARQIVQGLSEIHEAGFVQGDFTLSNIVIDDDGNAKIIDINRRGCPVGWEPPEATPLIQSDQRISMYIGVKSDLYQLGMVLWALATQNDDPEAHGRPLYLDADVKVPRWYRTIVETCLAENPRVRAQARQLLSYFPRPNADLELSDDSDYDDDWVDECRDPALYTHSATYGSFDDGNSSLRHRAGIESASVSDANDDGTNTETFHGGSRNDLPIDGYTGLAPRIKTVTPIHDWSHMDFGHTYVDPMTGLTNEPYFYPTRGRSPPSPVDADTGRDGSYRAVSWTRMSRAKDDPSLDDVDGAQDDSREDPSSTTKTPARATFADRPTTEPTTEERAMKTHTHTQKQAGDAHESQRGGTSKGSGTTTQTKEEGPAAQGEDAHRNGETTSVGRDDDVRNQDDQGAAAPSGYEDKERDDEKEKCPTAGTLKKQATPPTGPSGDMRTELLFKASAPPSADPLSKDKIGGTGASGQKTEVDATFDDHFREHSSTENGQETEAGGAEPNAPTDDGSGAVATK